MFPILLLMHSVVTCAKNISSVDANLKTFSYFLEWKKVGSKKVLRYT